MFNRFYAELVSVSEAIPAIRYIFYFLKKKVKGCRCYQG
jgi:hypothetical protein